MKLALVKSTLFIFRIDSSFILLWIFLCLYEEQRESIQVSQSFI